MNDLQTLRAGRSALRQLQSLARKSVLMRPDFDRLTGKIQDSLNVARRPGAMAKVRHLRSLGETSCLTDLDFDRLTRGLEREFAAILGADPLTPGRPSLQVIDGGRR